MGIDELMDVLEIFAILLLLFDSSEGAQNQGAGAGSGRTFFLACKWLPSFCLYIVERLSLFGFFLLLLLPCH